MYEDEESMTLKWQHGILSNYDYLLYINSLADRWESSRCIDKHDECNSTRGITNHVECFDYQAESLVVDQVQRTTLHIVYCSVSDPDPGGSGYFDHVGSGSGQVPDPNTDP